METESHSNNLDVCALSSFHFGHVSLTSDVCLSVCLTHQGVQQGMLRPMCCADTNLMHASPQIACIVAHAKLGFTPGPIKNLRYRWNQLARWTG